MSTTVPGKVNWHLHALVTALQDPHKNVLIVYGNHRIAKISFQNAIDELVKNLPDYPCQINHQQLVITMAEGGRIHFQSMERQDDADRIRGYDFGTAVYDESWNDLVRGVSTRDYIRHIVASRIRQR